jgi:hypothetical protein
VLKSTLDTKRRFKLRVKEFVLETKLVRGDSKGQRRYTIKDNGSGTVTVTIQEHIGGLMFPMYAKYIPSLCQR